MNNKKVQIGVVGVDSGQLMVCDPGYLQKEWINREFLGDKGRPTGEFSYDGACRATLTKEGVGQLNFKRGHAGAGVAFSTKGDGTYPVFAEYDKEGRIVRVIIEVN
jgi:hypothetical protein